MGTSPNTSTQTSSFSLKIWTKIDAFNTHQIVVDWLLSSLVVCFLDFGLFERVRYVQCTCIETSIFVVAVVVWRRINVTTAIVIAIRCDLPLNCVENVRDGKLKPIKWLPNSFLSRIFYSLLPLTERWGDCIADLSSKCYKLTRSKWSNGQIGWQRLV